MFSRDQILGLLALLLLLLVFLCGLFIYKSFPDKNDIQNQPELVMGIIVVAAIAALMSLLYILAAGFNFMNLTDGKQALGLPEGSIRAMIALILIMVFIIFGIYLFRSIGYGFTTVLEKDISADSLRHIDMGRYKGLQTSILTTRNDSTSLYSIVATNQTSAEGSRLAQQLLTTIGTLVVAIASFYFGSATVNSAISKDRASAPTTTTVSSVPPVTTTTTIAPTVDKDKQDDATTVQPASTAVTNTDATSADQSAETDTDATSAQESAVT
jgi:hypothetical protein